jgi:hypothetical protein
MKRRYWNSPLRINAIQLSMVIHQPESLKAKGGQKK